ncbi:MAG: hypothetical protein ABUT39_09340 [Acidobacteriota bacterium]
MNQDDDKDPQDNPAPVGATTITEFLVRDSISDEENRLTADHHLNGRPHPAQNETDSGDEKE